MLRPGDRLRFHAAHGKRARFTEVGAFHRERIAHNACGLEHGHAFAGGVEQAKVELTVLRAGVEVAGRLAHRALQQAYGLGGPHVGIDAVHARGSDRRAAGDERGGHRGAVHVAVRQQAFVALFADGDLIEVHVEIDWVAGLELLLVCRCGETQPDAGAAQAVGHAGEALRDFAGIGNVQRGERPPVQGTVTEVPRGVLFGLQVGFAAGIADEQVVVVCEHDVEARVAAFHAVEAFRAIEVEGDAQILHACVVERADGHVDAELQAFPGIGGNVRLRLDRVAIAVGADGAALDLQLIQGFVPLIVVPDQMHVGRGAREARQPVERRAISLREVALQVWKVGGDGGQDARTWRVHVGERAAVVAEPGAHVLLARRVHA